MFAPGSECLGQTRKGRDGSTMAEEGTSSKDPRCGGWKYGRENTGETSVTQRYPALCLGPTLGPQNAKRSLIWPGWKVPLSGGPILDEETEARGSSRPMFSQLPSTRTQTCALDPPPPQLCCHRRCVWLDLALTSSLFPRP